MHPLKLVIFATFLFAGIVSRDASVSSNESDQLARTDPPSDNDTNLFAPTESGPPSDDDTDTLPRGSSIVIQEHPGQLGFSSDIEIQQPAIGRHETPDNSDLPDIDDLFAEAIARSRARQRPPMASGSGPHASGSGPHSTEPTPPPAMHPAPGNSSTGRLFNDNDLVLDISGPRMPAARSGHIPDTRGSSPPNLAFRGFAKSSRGGRVPAKRVLRSTG